MTVEAVVVLDGREKGTPPPQVSYCVQSRSRLGLCSGGLKWRGATAAGRWLARAGDRAGALASPPHLSPSSPLLELLTRKRTCHHRPAQRSPPPHSAANHSLLTRFLLPFHYWPRDRCCTRRLPLPRPRLPGPPTRLFTGSFKMFSALRPASRTLATRVSIRSLCNWPLSVRGAHPSPLLSVGLLVYGRRVGRLASDARWTHRRDARGSPDQERQGLPHLQGRHQRPLPRPRGGRSVASLHYPY